MWRPGVAVAVMLVSAGLAGCVGLPVTVEPAARAAATPPTVVAVIDTGINPYHAAFRGGPDFDAVPDFPATATRFDLALAAPDYDAAVLDDASEWADVDPQELLWFPGTRVAGIGFGRADASPVEVLDHFGHGTSVTHSVLAATPHAVVVVLAIADDPDIAPAMQWAARQPWIDIVTVSWAKSLAEYGSETMMGLQDAYREAARAGKLLVNSAGNEPVTHWGDEHNGPPFVIAVGGALNASKGERRTAARFPDVIADYDQHRAAGKTLDDTRDVSGTSFSAPTVAGTLADAVWRVRAALGVTFGGTGDGALLHFTGPGALLDDFLTAEEVRHAMNLRADVWTTTDWDPDAAGDDPQRSNPVLAPAAQMGWGYVTPQHGADIAAHLLADAPLPQKDASIVAFMTARESARQAAWGGA